MSVWKTRRTLQRTKAAVENEAESFLFLFFTFSGHVNFPKAVEFLHHLQYEKKLPPSRLQCRALEAPGGPAEPLF